MSLNSKNEVAHKPTRPRKRLNRTQARNTAEIFDHLLEIGQDCAKRLKKPFRSVEHGDVLYNEKGLPK